MSSDLDINSLYAHSAVLSLLERTFTKVDEAIVDGELWHTVMVTKENSGICSWLKENGAVETTTSWPINACFDIPDKLYTLLILRWS